MRFIMIFAPRFIEWPKAICNELQNKDERVEIIALATTIKVKERLQELQNKGECNFFAIECFEEQAKLWLDQGYDEKRLRKHEKKFGTDIVNNILIADRQVGQGFISCADHVETDLCKLTASHDQKRAYISGCIDFALDLHKKFKPKAVFFYSVADANTAALASVLKAKRVETLRLTHTRIDDRYMLDTSAYGFFANLDASKKVLDDKALVWAKKWLRESRANLNKEPDYMLSLRKLSKSQLSVLGILKNIAHASLRLMFYKLLKGERPLVTETGWQRLKDAFAIPFKKFYFGYKNQDFDVAYFRDRSFLYYALHVDPEASTMHLAPDHTDQLSVIEALAKRKPLHMDLLVKEHPNMIGKRPFYFYEAIKKMPGVYLVPSQISSQMLVKASSLVATITGTVAWEAIMLGKPALIIGQSPYTHQKILKSALVQHSDLSTLGAAISKALSLKPLPEGKLIQFIANLYQESFAVGTGEVLYTTSSEDVCKKSDILDRLVCDIHGYLVKK